MASEQNILEQLSEAQGFLITGLYSLAKEKFTSILQSNANNYEALLYRGYANLRLNSLEEALKDADSAVSANSNRSEALLLKGTVLFHLGKYDEALNQIGRAKLVVSALDASDPRRVEIQLWEQKAESAKARRTTVNVDNLNKKPEEQKTEKSNTATASFHPQLGKITYKWNQTDTRVYININFAVKKKEDLKLKIDPKRVEVSFPIDDSKNYELNLNLFDEIDAEKSSYNILLDRIEIQLEKKIRERNWTFLEGSSSQNERILETFTPKPVTQPVAQGVPAYPSSSKVKRDWSKIDQEIEEDMKKNKDDYQEEDPLNSFFKQIYKGADENTRRAMMKSFQTSGGTVLSTNWDEVKEKDYESKDRPDAPAGQEYKDWRK